MLALAFHRPGNRVLCCFNLLPFDLLQFVLGSHLVLINRLAIGRLPRVPKNSSYEQQKDEGLRIVDWND